MKPWLIALLVAAAPQEDCEMAQKPVLYPGSVVSRNSQVRQAALQGAAYETQDPRLFNPATTLDDGLVTTGAFAGNADTLYIARVKGLVNDGDVSFISCTIGTAASGRVGIALYELQYIPERDTVLFRLVPSRSGWVDISASNATRTLSFSAARPYMVKRNSAYAIGVVTSNAVTANAEFADVGSSSIEYGVAVTESGGFPASMNTSVDEDVGFLFHTSSTRVYKCRLGLRGATSMIFY